MINVQQQFAAFEDWSLYRHRYIGYKYHWADWIHLIFLTSFDRLSHNQSRNP